MSEWYLVAILKMEAELPLRFPGIRMDKVEYLLGPHGQQLFNQMRNIGIDVAARGGDPPSIHLIAEDEADIALAKIAMGKAMIMDVLTDDPRYLQRAGDHLRAVMLRRIQAFPPVNGRQ